MPKAISRSSMSSNISTNTSSINRLKSFNQTMNQSKDKSTNKELNQIYTRLNDLRKLEYFYFKIHEKSLIETQCVQLDIF